MLKRDEYIKQIVPFIDKDVIKVLTGIRRSGKSVMLKLLMEELKNRGINENQFIYINFENLKYRNLKNYEKLYDFILNREGKYHFINDVYFDESVLLQTYLEYIASYETYDNHIKSEKINHPDIHMKRYIDLSDIKFSEVGFYELLIKNRFGTIKEVIELELLRPV